MRNVIFYGELKNQFDDFSLHAENDTVLVSGILSRYPTFKRAAIKYEAVFHFDEDRNCHIAPKAQGAFWGAIIAAVQIIGAVGAVYGAAVAIQQAVIQKQNKRKLAREQESSLFQGVINSDVQGGPIPLAFGDVYCGSVVINNELEPY